MQVGLFLNFALTTIMLTKATKNNSWIRNKVKLWRSANFSGVDGQQI